MAIVMPLDLYTWLVTTFAGNMAIFTALAFLAIATLSAMFRMPNAITFICFGLFVIMLSIYMQAVAILVLLVAGLAIGWALQRLWK